MEIESLILTTFGGACWACAVIPIPMHRNNAMPMILGICILTSVLAAQFLFCSTLGKVRVALDLANLLNVPLGVGRDLEHPLPAIDHFTGAEAMGAQVVVG